MKSREIIPLKAEFSFILKIFAVTVLGVVSALSILFVFLNRDLNISYALAFQTMLEVFRKLNTLIIIAILVQLLISTILIYALALLFSHKIAGPVFRLKMILRQYIQGSDPKEFSFRRTDFLPGLERLFNDFFFFLSKRKKTLEKVESLIEHLKDLDEKEQAAEQKKIKALISELES